MIVTTDRPIAAKSLSVYGLAGAILDALAEADAKGWTPELSQAVCDAAHEIRDRMHPEREACDKQ